MEESKKERPEEINETEERQKERKKGKGKKCGTEERKKERNVD